MLWLLLLVGSETVAVLIDAYLPQLKKNDWAEMLQRAVLAISRRTSCWPAEHGPGVSVSFPMTCRKTSFDTIRRITRGDGRPSGLASALAL